MEKAKQNIIRNKNIILEIQEAGYVIVKQVDTFLSVDMHGRPFMVAEEHKAHRFVSVAIAHKYVKSNYGADIVFQFIGK